MLLLFQTDHRPSGTLAAADWRFNMGILDIIVAVLLIITSILVVALVSMQESKKGMSALGGGSESYGRNFGRTRDAMLIKGTKILTAVFFGLTILVSLVDKFM